MKTSQQEIYKPIGNRYGDRYEVSNYGNVISIKPTGNRVHMTLTENKKDEDSKGYLSVTLRTEDKKTVKEYVSRLVVEAFHLLPVGYNRQDYVVTYRDEDIHNNIFLNLKLELKSEFARRRMTGLLRNKVLDIRDLPKDAILLESKIYRQNEIINTDGHSLLWIYYRKKYHNVTLIDYPGVVGPLRGSLVIRIDRKELPAYYQSYLTRKKLSQSHTAFVTVPISVLMLEEIYKKGRPSLKHKPGYSDFNCLNITRENLVWETSAERNERIYEAVPALRDKIVYTGKKNRLDMDAGLSDIEIFIIEELYFDKLMDIKEILIELGPDKSYSSVYYQILRMKKAGRSRGTSTEHVF